MISRTRPLLTAALVMVAASGLLGRSGFTWEELEAIDKKWPQAVATTTGLRYVVLKEGNGAVPKSGDTVRVLFKSMFFDGRVFDQAANPAAPFSFRLDRGEVIPGWDQAIAMMREGEKRTLIVPYDLAYGSRGRPPLIPRLTSLVFEVEILAIEPNPATSPAVAPTK